jgi:hypothetical protein
LRIVEKSVVQRVFHGTFACYLTLINDDAKILARVPIWFARYNHKGRKIALVIDGNSGSAINSVGL